MVQGSPIGVSMVQGPENNPNKKAAKKRKLLFVEMEEQPVSFFAMAVLIYLDISLRF